MRTYSFRDEPSRPRSDTASYKDYLCSIVPYMTGYFSNYCERKYGYELYSNSYNPRDNIEKRKTSNSKKNYWFGSDEQASNAKEWFQKVDNSTMWQNPLKVKAEDVTCNDDICKAVFTINFGDYFDSVSGIALKSNYQPYFKYWLKVNGVYLTDAPAYRNGELHFNDGYHGIESGLGSSAGLNLTFDPSTTLEYEKTKGTYIIEVTLSKSSYVEGTTFSLYYETFHPLSADNVFIVSPPSGYDRQRMVVYSPYIEKNEVPGGNTEIQKLECKMEKSGTSFKYQTPTKSNVSLKEYISECGCEKVQNYSDLSTSAKNTYNNLCENEKKETLSFNLDDCNSSGNKNGTAKLEKVKTLSEYGNYCTLSCTETVDINGLLAEGEVNTLAGETFSVTNPTILANKKCNLTVKYEKWENDYQKLLKDLKDKYNNYQKLNAKNNADEIKIAGCCDRDPETGVCYENRYSHEVSNPNNYPEYKVNGNSLSKSGTFDGYYTTCGAYDKTFNLDSAKTALANAIEKLETHLGYLTSCNTFLSSKSSDEFYNFKSDLNFYYMERYANGLFYANSNDSLEDFTKSSLFTNPPSSVNLRSDSVDDSKFTYVKNEKTENDSNDYTVMDGCSYYELNSDFSIKEVTSNVGNYCNTAVKDLVRERTYDIEYIPAVNKLVELHKYKVHDTNEIGLDKQNMLSIGNVYDTHVTSVARKNNQYYWFKSLGDVSILGNANNELYSEKNISGSGDIYDYLNNNPDYDLEASLKRTCTYNIKNEVFETDDPSTPQTPKREFNVVYRIVSPNNLDPNGRLKPGDYANTIGFKNWIDAKGETVKKEIEKVAETEDTFNPDNLEYEFIIDGGVIKKIRDYNKDHSYNDFNLKCNDDGLECISEFIKNYETNYGKATIRAGSNKWRYLEYDETKEEKYSIGIYERNKYYETHGAYENIKVGEGELHP